MVIRELLFKIRSALDENAAFEAKQIVKSALDIDENYLIINPQKEVTPEAVKRAEEMLKRRVSGEPLQYILGEAEFMSLTFEVNPATLIPRSDTETLVEELINIIGKNSPKVLDIGTGSGCIGISLAKYTSARVTLADISEKALETAKKNAKRNGVSVDVVRVDILAEIPEDEFDIIVSNPPYIRTDVIETLQRDVKDYEPKTALDGGADGLIFYKRITDIAPKLLTQNGILAYEIGYDQGEEVSEVMAENFYDVRVIKDLCGNDRVVTGILKK